MKTGFELPRWLPLFLLLPLYIVLGYIEGSLPLSPLEHTLAQLLILWVIYSLTVSWLKANEIGLLNETRFTHLSHRASSKKRIDEKDPCSHAKTH